jgi:hypothetical protein
MNQAVPDGYFLVFGASHKLLINEWWGREADLLTLVSSVPLPNVKMDFGDWMQ